MGWQVLLRHLAELKPPASIHETRSSDEGLVSCYFSCYPGENEPPVVVNIQLCASNIDEYPEGNAFMIFTTDESVNQNIPKALGDLSERTHGQSLSGVLEEISELLTHVITCEPSIYPQKDTDSQSERSDFEFEDDSDVEFGFAKEPILPRNFGKPASSTLPSSVDPARLRKDLIALKDAGFRIGVLGDLKRAGILCVSLRIAKLGLSEEALEAWNLQRKQYFLLMIAYPQGYRDIDRVKQEPTLSGLAQIRVGVCDHYKPQLAHVLPLFPGIKSGFWCDMRTAATSNQSILQPLFIGKPLNELLHGHFPAIIRARLNHGLSWLGAEQFVQTMQAASSIEELEDMSQFHVNDAFTSESFPPLTVTTADHVAQASSDCLSLPLVAMQFAIRHLSRCTEFCLVCHRCLDNSFGALKPYVCSKPLCLYQYMAIGFGPSIEREIVSQPLVVDLLISFCFFAAQARTLKVLPTGMGLQVPLIPRPNAEVSTVQNKHHGPYAPKSKDAPTPQTTIKESFTCLWKLEAEENVIDVEEDSSQKLQRLRPGNWVFIISDDKKMTSYGRIKRIQLPRVELGDVIALETLEQAMANLKLSRGGAPSKCYIYDHNFDDLSDLDKHHGIHTLILTLPSVEEMRKYLLCQGADAKLGDWTARMSPSAVSLLRWIIASNTSSIIQLNHLDEDGTFEEPTSVQDRVGGMEGWIQFRFAQGAPDKEKRFLECVKKACPEKQHPTLFGWHGSVVGNWHSIIRQGLRFDSIVNGRAFGNGVYLSPYASTSVGYARGSFMIGWKQSHLQIQSALSLSEVVNQPTQFVSRQPHYVVGNIDWIQTRYLFVKSKIPTESCGQPSAVYEQDPSHTVYNERAKPITIPITAISKSRRPGKSIVSDVSGSTKRSKMVRDTDQATAERLNDDAESLASDDEDLAVFDGASDMILEKKREVEDADGEKTDFVPGSLDVSGIQFLAPPKEASMTSTRALMRSFREILAVQEDTSPAKLGWYINPDMAENMYQWIVELHSFPHNLPLSKDMKAAGLTSVVLEMRFSNNYPFAPPFIRVVKPRFLPFRQGGGGNVTEGGAMCMEALTNTGWTAAQAIDGLLLQVRMAILDEERPARLATRGNAGRETYGIGEAVEAYIRACRNHGWTVPEGFEKMAFGQQ
ncbi:hypothetical protein LTR84_000608 [Exophiala bonariae]|uniref:UBC core domain-containing protein n=1 Tax=Exophiala bonariae TaxID=1690606 RepID=A0AAV9NSU1_9EURO|nr:hypothetical protein LTR84_000608 [Exophiala bonariae]